VREAGGRLFYQCIGRQKYAPTQRARPLLTSSADTRISLAFSSASCLMNRTICSIWRWTCWGGRGSGCCWVWWGCETSAARARGTAALASAGGELGTRPEEERPRSCTARIGCGVWCVCVSRVREEAQGAAVGGGAGARRETTPENPASLSLSRSRARVSLPGRPGPHLCFVHGAPSCSRVCVSRTGHGRGGKGFGGVGCE
jgi:hypothetical protein